MTSLDLPNRFLKKPIVKPSFLEFRYQASGNKKSHIPHNKNNAGKYRIWYSLHHAEAAIREILCSHTEYQFGKKLSIDFGQHDGESVNSTAMNFFICSPLTKKFPRICLTWKKAEFRKPLQHSFIALFIQHKAQTMPRILIKLQKFIGSASFVYFPAH